MTCDSCAKLKKRVREEISRVHPVGHPELGCKACDLYRDCAPTPVDPWELIARAAMYIRAGSSAPEAQLSRDIDAALKAHESEGKG